MSMMLTKERNMSAVNGIAKDIDALDRLKEVTSKKNIKVIQCDDKMPCCVIFNRVERNLIIRLDITKKDIEDIINLCT